VRVTVNVPEAAALGREPDREGRTALKLEALEELALERTGQPVDPLRPIGRGAVSQRCLHFDGIDAAIREVECDGVGCRQHPAPSRLVENSPQLAQGPSQLTAWIAWNVPQEFA